MTLQDTVGKSMDDNELLVSYYTKKFCNVGTVFTFLLAIQYGMQPFLVKRFSPDGVDKSLIVFMGEMAKGAITLCLLYKDLVATPAKEQLKKSPQTGLADLKDLQQWTLKKSVQSTWLPALIYAIQNYLNQIAYQELPMLTFNLLNQTKTFSMAFFVWFLVGKGQSIQQIFSLSLLTASSIILICGIPGYDDKKIEELEKQKSISVLGVVCVMMAAFTSGLAGAACQKQLQLVKRNVHIFSFDLCLMCGFISLIPLFVKSNGTLHFFQLWFCVMAFLSYIAAFLWVQRKSRRNTLVNISSKQQQLVMTWTDNVSLVSAAVVVSRLINHFHEDIGGLNSVSILVPVMSQACGGLIVAQVTKHSGGLAKSFGIILGIILTSLLELVLTGKYTLPLKLVVSIPLTVLSVIIHSQYPLKSKP